MARSTSTTGQPTVRVPASSRFLGLRLPLSTYEELRQAAEQQGKLVSEYVRELIWKAAGMEKEIKRLENRLKAEEAIRVLPCSACGKPMPPMTRGQLVQAFTGWAHSTCISKGTPS